MQRLSWHLTLLGFCRYQSKPEDISVQFDACLLRIFSLQLASTRSDTHTDSSTFQYANHAYHLDQLYLHDNEKCIRYSRVGDAYPIFASECHVSLFYVQSLDMFSQSSTHSKHWSNVLLKDSSWRSIRSYVTRGTGWISLWSYLRAYYRDEKVFLGLFRPFLSFSYVAFFVNLGKFAVLRTFRVLRALKTVAVVPGRGLRTLLLSTDSSF